MRIAIIAATVGLMLVPRPAQAWGFDVHRFVMDRAIALLPDDIRPVFEKHRALVVERSIDPDTWRTAGFESEPPNHFLDLDWEGFGKYPFAELPRDYADAVEKFGARRIRENGTLPWRAEEFFGNLRRAFERHATNQYGSFDLLFYTATLAHYIGDAHVPFHAVWNYDGQLTGQHGIHSRFETELFERYRDRLAIRPAAPEAIRDVRAFVFDRLLEGTKLAPQVLDADRAAIGDRDEYDEPYYAAFFASNREILERRLNESITAIAGVIIGAWEAAGRPAVPVDPPRPPQRRRRS